MRLLLSIFTVVLLVIAVPCLGFGLYILAAGTHLAGVNGFLASVEAAAMPLIIGTIALGAAATVFAIEALREQLVKTGTPPAKSMVSPAKFESR